MLWFMVGTAHFYRNETFVGDLGGGKVAVFLVISLVIWAVLEANALGFIGGVAAGHPGKQIYETVRTSSSAASCSWAIYWLLSELFLKAVTVSVATMPAARWPVMSQYIV